VDGTVGNGGFQALLEDDPDQAGPMLAAAIAGAELIGASAHAKVLRAFLAVGPASRAGQAFRDACERGEEMEDELNATIDVLDASYFALPTIGDPLGRYAKAHPTEFATDLTLVQPPQQPTGQSEWLLRCPEFAADPAALASAVTEVVQTIRSQGLHPNESDNTLVTLARAHILTVLANADSSQVSREELIASALYSARATNSAP
jgi:Domain of unknown function (DUF4375)